MSSGYQLEVVGPRHELQARVRDILNRVARAQVAEVNEIVDEATTSIVELIVTGWGLPEDDALWEAFCAGYAAAPGYGELYPDRALFDAWRRPAVEVGDEVRTATDLAALGVDAVVEVRRNSQRALAVADTGPRWVLDGSRLTDTGLADTLLSPGGVIDAVGRKGSTS